LKNIFRLYFSIENGRLRKPALYQLYRHTFVPYSKKDGYTSFTAPNQLSRGSIIPYLSRNIKIAQNSITERRVPELIPVLGSQPAGDVSHKPSARLPLLSARPAVTLATLKRDAANFAAW